MSSMRDHCAANVSCLRPTVGAKKKSVSGISTT